MSWWRSKLLEVAETGGGWFVERHGRRVAVLTDPRYVDIFWYAWRIEPLVDEEAEKAALFTEAYWNSPTSFRSREYHTLANAFCAIKDPVRDGRLVMRGLYQPIRQLWPWERLVLWFRQRKSRQYQPDAQAPG
jgi:hypothetical protein